MSGPRGADLVLLSGLLSDDTIWSEAIPALSGVRSVKILSFPGVSSIEAMARQVLAAAPATFHLAGHSMGGRVALEVFRLDPTRVHGLALLNTGIHPRREAEIAGRLRLVQLARSRGMSALAREWLPPMMGDDPTRIAAVMPRLTAMVERGTPEGFAAQIEALIGRPDATPVLARIRVPTLLLSGTADTWSPISQHREMQERIAGSELAEIEHAGHMAPVEQPAAVAAALTTWLARS